MYAPNTFAMQQPLHVLMTHLPPLVLRVPRDATLDKLIAPPDYVSALTDVSGIIGRCNVHPQKVGVKGWPANADQQQKDGHRKTLIAGATAVRRPLGVAFLVGLNARHDRFLLPSRPRGAAQ